MQMGTLHCHRDYNRVGNTNGRAKGRIPKLPDILQQLPFLTLKRFLLLQLRT